MLDWSKLQVKIGLSGKVRCEKGWRLTKEWSENLGDCDLWVVRNGRGKMIIENDEIELKPGICIWMRPGRCYLAEQDLDSRLAITYIHFSLFSNESLKTEIFDDLPNEVLYLEPIYAELILSRIVEYASPTRIIQTNIARIQIAEHFLKSVLMELSQPAQKDFVPKSNVSAQRHVIKIRQIIDDIREDPSQNWSIRQLSCRANLSPDHFTRIFHSITDTNPKEFLIEVKIARAKMLLQNQRLPVGEVADLLGYSSHYYFSRQVRLHTGYTPTQLRHLKEK